MQDHIAGLRGIRQDPQQIRICLAVVDHQWLAQAHGQVDVPAQSLFLRLHGGGGFILIQPVGIQAGLSDCHASRVLGHLLQALPGRAIQFMRAGGVDGTRCPHAWMEVRSL